MSFFLAKPAHANEPSSCRRLRGLYLVKFRKIQPATNHGHTRACRYGPCSSGGGSCGDVSPTNVRFSCCRRTIDASSTRSLSDGEPASSTGGITSGSPPSPSSALMNTFPICWSTHLLNSNERGGTDEGRGGRGRVKGRRSGRCRRVRERERGGGRWYRLKT